MSLPFLRWAGGKRWLAQKIAPQLAPRLSEASTYIEPFVGAGAMYFALGPSRAILSDNNGDLIETYKALRKHPTQIAEGLSALPISKEEYYRIRESAPGTLVDRAIRFIYLNRTCYGGVHRTNKKGQFNVPYGGGDRTPEGILEPGGILEQAAATLQQTSSLELMAGDFEFAIKKARSGDVVYADPCYRGKERTGYDDYGPKRFSFEDQQRLAKCLLEAYQRDVLVLLSTQTMQGFEELVRAGITLTFWRKPGLVQSLEQSGKEFLLVLDPKHEVQRWDPLSDLNVKLNGKERSDSKRARPSSTGEIMRHRVRLVAKCLLDGKGQPKKRRSKWAKPLAILFNESEDGLSHGQIKRELHIPHSALGHYLRKWKREDLIKQDVRTKTWRVSNGSIPIMNHETNGTVFERAKTNQIGSEAQYRLERISRENLLLLERIAEGHISLDAAFSKIRSSKTSSLLLKLRSLWKRANEYDRRAFLSEINGHTPPESALTTPE